MLRQGPLDVGPIDQSGSWPAALSTRSRSASRAVAAVSAFVGIAAASVGAATLFLGSPVAGAWFVLLGVLVCWLAHSAYRDEGDDTRTPHAE